ncbi:MAG: hypothetical protein Q9160_007582 [Pyrenula sp. 1 TL-2023]
MSGFLAFLVGASGCCAITLRASTIEQRNDLKPPSIFSPSPGNQQVHLSNQPDHKTHIGLPVENFMNLIFTANVSIGTPEQSFLLAVTTADDIIAVPSSKCEDFCGEPTNQYNSSLSSTYHPNGSDVTFNFGFIDYAGEVSEDSIHIGRNEIPRAAFEEWNYMTCRAVGCFDLGYDGILGLAPPWHNRPSILNPLSVMLDHGLLDEPMFSLKLPRSEGDQGDLLFGASDPSLYNAPLARVPITNAPENSVFHNLWTVSIDHATFNTTIPLSQTFKSSSIGMLDSSSPYLALPGEIARSISAAIGARPGPYWFENVPCSDRLYLPSLTIGLGGHNFTLSAFDYTLEIYLKGTGSVCLVTFIGSDEFGFGEDYAWLGAPFMRGVYSVFDMEKREVGSKLNEFENP